MRTPLEELSRQQYAFVMEFIGAGNAYTAAIHAGYTEIIAAQAGDILLRNDCIKRAIRHLRATHRESVRQQILIASSGAVGTLMDVMNDPVCPHAARVQAAKELLALSNTHIPQDASETCALDSPLDALPGEKVRLVLMEGGKTGKP